MTLNLPITRTVLLALGIFALLQQTSWAHFIWLAPQLSSGARSVQVYFGEEASPDDPDLLPRLNGMKAWLVAAGKPAMKLELSLEDGELSAQLPETIKEPHLLIASHDLGVLSRGESTFRLKYYAKAAPADQTMAWSAVNTSNLLKLDVVPRVLESTIEIQVRFAGKPVAEAEVKATGPGLDEFSTATDANGSATIPLKKAGIYSIRARHLEQQSGMMDDKQYDEVRHYSTITLQTESGELGSQVQLEPLPELVTSFGAAIVGQEIYTYGGHTGDAHEYSQSVQSNKLRRLDLTSGKWSVLAEGPRLQGLALVAHQHRLYRLGGFSAKNAAGEEHDLWSQSGAAAFDLQANRWLELPPLPEPRSSFDAAVLDNTIYVVGGWKLAGEDENVWHETVWGMDLTVDNPQWQLVTKAPFQRRALSVAAHDGKLYAIGGMNREGGPTRRVDIFNPQTGDWSMGPELHGEDGMTGFGNAAFATGGQLYVTTIKGDLQRLSQDGSRWEIIQKTPTARFFHRMLPVDQQRLAIVGGASMATGKFEQVEILPVK